VVLMALLLVNFFNRTQRTSPAIIFSQFLDDVSSSQVAKVTIQGNQIQGELRSGEPFKTYAPNDPDLVKTLREKQVQIEAIYAVDQAFSTPGPGQASGAISMSGAARGGEREGAQIKPVEHPQLLASTAGHWPLPPVRLIVPRNAVRGYRMRRTAHLIATLAVTTLLAASPAGAQSNAPPHAWLFGAWIGGLFPPPSAVSAQECLAQPVVIFTRDIVMRATLTDQLYTQRLVETARSTGSGFEFRFAQSLPISASSPFGQISRRLRHLYYTHHKIIEVRFAWRDSFRFVVAED
jgi:hypothetical protein